MSEQEERRDDERLTEPPETPEEGDAESAVEEPAARTCFDPACRRHSTVTASTSLPCPPRASACHSSVLVLLERGVEAAGLLEHLRPGEGREAILGRQAARTGHMAGSGARPPQSWKNFIRP
jgi:hypothetical protein